MRAERSLPSDSPSRPSADADSSSDEVPHDECCQGHYEIETVVLNHLIIKDEKGTFRVPITNIPRQKITKSEEEERAESEFAERTRRLVDARSSDVRAAQFRDFNQLAAGPGLNRLRSRFRKAKKPERRNHNYFAGDWTNEERDKFVRLLTNCDDGKADWHYVAQSLGTGREPGKLHLKAKEFVPDVKWRPSRPSPPSLYRPDSDDSLPSEVLPPALLTPPRAVDDPAVPALLVGESALSPARSILTATPRLGHFVGSDGLVAAMQAQSTAAAVVQQKLMARLEASDSHVPYGPALPGLQAGESARSLAMLPASPQPRHDDGLLAAMQAKSAADAVVQQELVARLDASEREKREMRGQVDALRVQRAADDVPSGMLSGILPYKTAFAREQTASPSESNSSLSGSTSVAFPPNALESVDNFTTEETFRLYDSTYGKSGEDASETSDQRAALNVQKRARRTRSAVLPQRTPARYYDASIEDGAQAESAEERRDQRAQSALGDDLIEEGMRELRVEERRDPPARNVLCD